MTLCEKSRPSFFGQQNRESGGRRRKHGRSLQAELEAQANGSQRQNIQNGISYLQVQDGALGVVGKILDRISELRTMSMDVTKNSGDMENYSKEFVELQNNLIKSGTKSSTGSVCSLSTIRVRPIFNPEGQLVKINLQGGSLRYTNSSDVSAVARYDKYAFELMTSPSGKDTDGSISLNVINFEFMLSLGSVADTI